MQILRTDVAVATAITGEQILRVQFCGEGGDCVTIDMAGVEPETREAALERAKAILVQIATFSAAANDYEAESNGNFDELAVTAADDENARVYIFEYRDGDGGRKIPPAPMPSFDAARAEAVRCAIDLLADLQPGMDKLSGWLVRVRGENGELLSTIDVQEAEAARHATTNSVTGNPVRE